jgi:hypothetical protein
MKKQHVMKIGEMKSHPIATMKTSLLKILFTFRMFKPVNFVCTLLASYNLLFFAGFDFRKICNLQFLQVSLHVLERLNL